MDFERPKTGRARIIMHIVTHKGRGRLGNQMFRYAYTRSLAEIHKVDWVYGGGKRKLGPVFDLPDCSKPECDKIVSLKRECGDFVDSAATVTNIKENPWYKAHLDLIHWYGKSKQWFIPKQKFVSNAKEFWSCFSSNACAWHIRAGDYKNTRKKRLADVKWLYGNEYNL